MARIARDAGPWTILKLQFLSEYLDAYVQATKRIQRSDVCYMDLFGGPGLDRNPDTGELVDGSPLIALGLHPSFRRFIFVDIEERNTQQLREIAFDRRLDRICHILTGDCNPLVNRALEAVPHDGATFCFVDPAGIDVHWETIRRIASHKAQDRYKVELFVLFAYDMDLVRFLVREGDMGDRWGPDAERRIDRALPDPVNWRKIPQARNDQAIDAQEARRRFAYLYWRGLRDLGYEYVVKPRLLNSPRGNPLYFLFFASDHYAGDKIMSHILQKPRGFEQLALPFLDDPWDFKEEGEDWYESIGGA